MTKKQKIKQKELQNQIRQNFITYLNAAFAFIAGLAWNEAIMSFIKLIFPFEKGTVLAKFIYAILVTILIALISSSLFKALKKSA